MSAVDAVRGHADAVLLAAHAAVHRYPPEFPGFTAKLAFRSDATTAEGRATVRPRTTPALAIELPDEDVSWIESELASLVSHRLGRPYDEGDGRFGKSAVDDARHPLGALVELQDPLASSYRVLDDAITLVTRRPPSAGRFSIVPQERMPAPSGGFVTTRFTVAHWDGQPSRLVRSDVYVDDYAAVGDLLLPCLRRVVSCVDTGVTVQELELSDHELLPAGGESS